MNDMDNETIVRMRDAAVGEELGRRYPDEDNLPARVLFEALELGASDDLLGSLGRKFVEVPLVEWGGDEVYGNGVRLKYVPELLAAGYSREEVRALFERLAQTHDNWHFRSYHRQAFWNDEASAQVLYGGAPEALRDFARKLALDNAHEVLKHHAALASMLSNRELFNEVMAEVVKHLYMIDSEEQLQVILGLPIPMRIEAAAGVNSLHPWNLVLQGYVLVRYNARGRRSVELFQHLRHEMHQTFWKDRPAQTPARWRWLAEGFRRGFRPPEPIGGEPVLLTWRHMMEYDHDLELALRDADIEFLKVQPVPMPGGRALQVTIKTPKGPVILRHDPKGPRGEQLAPGDTVIVSPALVDGKQPDFLLGGRPVFLDGTPQGRRALRGDVRRPEARHEVMEQAGPAFSWKGGAGPAEPN